jgi:hypothetical protein
VFTNLSVNRIWGNIWGTGSIDLRLCGHRRMKPRDILQTFACLYSYTNQILHLKTFDCKETDLA